MLTVDAGRVAVTGAVGTVVAATLGEVIAFASVAEAALELFQGEVFKLLG